MTLEVITLQEVDDTGASVGSPIDFDSNPNTPVFDETPSELAANNDRVLAARAFPLYMPYPQGGGGGSVRPNTGMIYPRGQG